MLHDHTLLKKKKTYLKPVSIEFRFGLGKRFHVPITAITKHFQGDRKIALLLKKKRVLFSRREIYFFFLKKQQKPCGAAFEHKRGVF
jgi:hypothetical protein